VRLALFAEMMKGKTWTTASLKAVGGTEGVGVTFLEETFSATTAPPEHRYHQVAARAVLKTLLPESGTDIKGHMRSYNELLAASGYGSRPKDFDDLIRILDSELRLITPTDPEGQERTEESTFQPQPGQKYYQLTHDYLVPSLRDWLTRKQKETRRGRAELLLADRAAVWNARPEKRQLPSLLQWLQIRWLTAKQNWLPPQRQMMRQATWHHVVRGLIAAFVLALLGFLGYESYGRLQAQALRDRLLDAKTNEVPTIVQDMALYRRWLDPLLRDARKEADANHDPGKQLHLSLALLPVDSGQVDYLYDRLLNAGPTELVVIRDALAGYRDVLVERLWQVVGDQQADPEQRFRAACVLAEYDANNREPWQRAAPFVIDQFLVSVQKNPSYYAPLLEMLRPARDKVQDPLAEVYRNRERPDAERHLATNLLVDYAADQPPVLAELLLDADEKQFAVIYPKFKERGEVALPVLTAEIARKLPPDLPSSDEHREKLAKRQANAAVALLQMNQPDKVWPLLQHSPDPRVRSYLIHRLSSLGADARTILKRLDEEPDISIRRALLLSLGEFSEKQLSLEDRKTLLPKLQEMFRTARDPGLHAASEWLLRTWKQDEWLKQVNDQWAKDKAQRETRLAGVRKLLAKDKDKTPPQWYVNGQGQTMVVIPGPVEFVMGSPLTEADRSDAEVPHKRRIGRTFALSATPVTKEQFLRYQPRFWHEEMKRYPELTCPIGGMTWIEAAVYCNWLSKEEGIDEAQWCYEIYPPGKRLTLKANYLSLTGYRLPTEAEMEYATRAGALTSRYYGETEELLSKYAWYDKNSKGNTSPVGGLKPNDLGLFDVQGNVAAWCQESNKAYPIGKDEEAEDDKEDNLLISNASRVLRGGSFTNSPAYVRSASRSGGVPINRFSNNGFRPARTIAP
jgi:formylglycine-generating enzyme required for sulfatase activity